jgi:hypothetical protein
MNQSFWDRRRAAVKAEADAEAAQVEAVKEAASASEVEAPKTDAEILEMLKLPDPETMVLGDDFSAFMAKAVPQHIKNRALRTLWRSNPILACVDGLNDYDDDYLTGSTGNGVLKTSYQVGKGLLAHVQEMERQSQAAAAKGDEAPVVAAEVSVAETPENASSVQEEVQEPVQADVVAFEQAGQTPAPRRMQFSFAGDAA